MQRNNASPTFTDLTLANLGSPRATAFFQTCQREIPFDRLAESVADIFNDNNPKGGAPALAGGDNAQDRVSAKVLWDVRSDD